MLCADPVGSGKTYLALALAQVSAEEPAACIVPPPLQDQWRETARRLGVAVTVWSHARLSRGLVPPGNPGIVVVDESHHFRNPDIRRYRTLAPWLIGRQVLLLSATPIVNRPQDLYHQLHLGLPDDALVDHGALSLRTAFKLDNVPPALGRFVVQREVTAAIPHRQDRSEVLESGATPLLPALDALTLSRSPEVAALMRAVLLHAAASSPAAVLATLRRYRLLLLQAQDAIAAGMPPHRRGLRRLLGTSHEQLLMWSLLPDIEPGGDLHLDDLPALDGLIADAQRATECPDPKAIRLAELLRCDRRTLVYVTARETISYLRRHLPDRWLAWCSGQRSGIGSATLSRENVLRWFRPDAPYHPLGLPGRPATLLTTDVTAEGLDLQGAGRVIHYDLPWTEVRLAQRDGRAIRRGSLQPAVEVIRFLPDLDIERRLHQLRVLTRKSALPAQYGLGPDGRARWRWRQETASAMAGAGMEGIGAVRSSRGGALAGVVLERDGQPIVSTVLVRVSRSRWVADAEVVQERLHEAATGLPLTPPSGAELRDCLVTLAPSIRLLLRHESLARVAGLPARAATLTVGRRLRELAARAARARDEELLNLLERGLQFCTRGHTAGEAIFVGELASCGDQALIEALHRLPPTPKAPSSLKPRLVGLVIFRKRPDQGNSGPCVLPRAPHSSAGPARRTA